MSQPEEILRLLGERPNLKAREVAQALGLDRRSVNALLHGSLRGKVVQDNSYRWTLRQAAAYSDRTETSRYEGNDTPLARLSRYYLDCLSFDADNGVSLFAASKYGQLDYFDPGLSSLEETLEEGLHLNGIQPLLRRLNQDRNRKTLVLGYPVRVRYMRARSGWTGYMVDPVMLFMLRGNPRDPATLGFEPLPTVNFACLRTFSISGGSDLIREAVQLTHDLGLADALGAPPELDELFSRLHAVRPEWDWREAPEVDALSCDTEISEITTEGIYNRAVICAIERSPYTQGLETELESLSRLPNTDYVGTALGSWIGGSVSDQTEPTDSVLLESLPLNSEQRTAIQQSLTRPLTVITGPPGTGKSQVVTALLMNAAWSRQRVLFASKNNKAVDVVEERANSFGPRPIILRLGNDEHRRALASYLPALLGAKTTAEDKASYERHLDIHHTLLAEMESQGKKLERIVSLRNQTDYLEQRTERVRNTLGDYGLNILRNISDKEAERVRAAALEVRKSLERAKKGSQSLLIQLCWPLIRGARERELTAAMQEVRLASSKLRVQDIIQPPTTSDPSQWHEFVNQVLDLCDSIDQVQAYFDSLAELQGGRFSRRNYQTSYAVDGTGCRQFPCLMAGLVANPTS